MARLYILVDLLYILVDHLYILVDCLHILVDHLYILFVHSSGPFVHSSGLFLYILVDHLYILVDHLYILVDHLYILVDVLYILVVHSSGPFGALSLSLGEGVFRTQRNPPPSYDLDLVQNYSQKQEEILPSDSLERDFAPINAHQNNNRGPQISEKDCAAPLLHCKHLRLAPYP